MENLPAPILAKIADYSMKEIHIVRIYTDDGFIYSTKYFKNKSKAIRVLKKYNKELWLDRGSIKNIMYEMKYNHDIRRIFKKFIEEIDMCLKGKMTDDREFVIDVVNKYIEGIPDEDDVFLESPKSGLRVIYTTVKFSE